MAIKNQKYKSKIKNADIRRLNDMKEVIYDQGWLKTAPNFELYYMLRGLKEKNGIRYDVTIIPPRLLGKEFIKTKGHYHFKNCPEVYKVLSGQGIFLLQKLKKVLLKKFIILRQRRNNMFLFPRFTDTQQSILPQKNW